MNHKKYLLLVGSDPELEYLLTRYLEKLDFSVETLSSTPRKQEIDSNLPAAVIYLSIESLEKDHFPNNWISSEDIPILVCSSTNNQDHAIELGVDYCLVQPFGFNLFRGYLHEAITDHHY